MHINPPGLVGGKVNAGVLEELDAVLGIHVLGELELPAPPPSASPRYQPLATPTFPFLDQRDYVILRSSRDFKMCPQSVRKIGPQICCESGFNDIVTLT